MAHPQSNRFVPIREAICAVLAGDPELAEVKSILRDREAFAALPATRHPALGVFFADSVGAERPRWASNRRDHAYHIEVHVAVRSLESAQACEDLLLRYGGHKYAAGMSIARERIPAFAERFKRVAAERLMGEDLVPTLTIDARLDPADLSEEFMDSLEQFAPFGPQNMRPIFVAPSLDVSETPHIVGRNHLKFRARAGNRSLECIGFGMGERIGELRGHTGRIDLAYIPERNEWRGERRLQLRVRDFQLV